tara:strand:- start:42 stop:254 length:213 start_codon:yes stop_codon:yes gene_type:complete
MQLKNNCFYKSLGPIMILISIIGFTFRENSKKIFYLPIGMVGIYLIAEGEFKRKIKRKNIFNKIKSFSRK